MGVKQKILTYINNLSNKLDQKLISDKEFVIISNNCWGAEVYLNLKKQYNTPFIGTFLFGPDYIKLLERFDHYMSQPLQFTTKSIWTDNAVTYPIGKLDDIEVHFMHYKNEEDAETKWNRRLARMYQTKDKNNYYFKISERDLVTADIIEKFHTLPFENKISFSAAPINSGAHVIIKKEAGEESVPDGANLYRVAFRYVDVLKWMKTGKISVNWYSKMKSITSIALVRANAGL